MLKDYPLFYDQCREKGGEMRSSGWRRMYKVCPFQRISRSIHQLTLSQKALEDAANRKATAADRMQQRYKELEDAKHARKIVVVDKLTVPTKGKAARGRQGGMVFARAGQPRRESTLIELLQAETDLYSTCADDCCGCQRNIWQSTSRSSAS